MENKKLTTKQNLLITLLVLLILLGLFWSLCWWYFTLLGLNSWDDYKSLVLSISLPSLIIGVLFIYLWYKWKNKVGNKNTLDWWQILLPAFLCWLIAFWIFFFFYGY